MTLVKNIVATFMPSKHMWQTCTKKRIKQNDLSFLFQENTM